jgi:signal transduction histidine kinase
MIGSLQTRLLLTVGALALAAVVAVALVARQGTRQEFRRLAELDVRVDPSSAAEARARARSQLDGRCCGPEAMAAAARELAHDQVLLVVEPRLGTLIASAGERLSSAARISTSRTGRRLSIDVTLGRNGGELVSLRVPADGDALTMADGTEARLHVLPLPNPEREQRVDAILYSMDLRLVWATGVIGALALAVTWAIARSSVRPLGALRAATHELALGRLAARVEPRGSREVVELGRDFNAMADDLERQHLLRQRLLHDVAHELRTPLTALQCRLETVIDGLARDPAQAVRDLHEDVRHLGSLVEDLQDVALAEAGELRLSIADQAAPELVDSALRAAGLDADARVRLDVPETLTLRADARRLRQILVNLLSNASRHTPPDGVIGIAATIAGGETLLSVSNTGSRLTPDECARVFDRFYRTDPARQKSTGGTGLGLSIVKHLVEAHGGRVWAESNAAGVAFHVALPVST